MTKILQISCSEPSMPYTHNRWNLNFKQCYKLSIISFKLRSQSIPVYVILWRDWTYSDQYKLIEPNPQHASIYIKRTRAWDRGDIFLSMEAIWLSLLLPYWWFVMHIFLPELWITRLLLFDIYFTTWFLFTWHWQCV